MVFFRSSRMEWPQAAVVAALLSALSAHAQGGGTVYRCPGNPILYTDAIGAKEARDKGCRTLEGAPITVIAAPRRVSNAAAGAAAAPAARPADSKIDPIEQKVRDTDARRILEAELRREEGRLSDLRAEYNKGEPERRGDERNYQKYLDRTAELKSGIARKENDIEALKRELSKTPQ
jgi:hypothetical protein